MALFKGKYRIESARLKGWDYASPGWYFVTICTRQMEPFFGDVVDGEMQLSPVGKAARAFWAEIPDHHPNVELDEYVIMPNHMHGIVVIKEPAVETPPTANVETPPTVETRYIASLQRPDSASAAKSRGRSLSVIIGTYKAAVTRWAGWNGWPDFAWQPRFHDHIIRDEGSLRRIQHYVVNNPAQWEVDRYHPTNLQAKGIACGKRPPP